MTSPVEKASFEDRDQDYWYKVFQGRESMNLEQIVDRVAQLERATAWDRQSPQPRPGARRLDTGDTCTSLLCPPPHERRCMPYDVDNASDRWQRVLTEIQAGDDDPRDRSMREVRSQPGYFHPETASAQEDGEVRKLKDCVRDLRTTSAFPPRENFAEISDETCRPLFCSPDQICTKEDVERASLAWKNYLHSDIAAEENAEGEEGGNAEEGRRKLTLNEIIDSCKDQVKVDHLTRLDLKLRERLVQALAAAHKAKVLKISDKKGSQTWSVQEIIHDGGRLKVRPRRIDIPPDAPSAAARAGNEEPSPLPPPPPPVVNVADLRRNFWWWIFREQRSADQGAGPALVGPGAPVGPGALWLTRDQIKVALEHWRENVRARMGLGVEAFQALVDQALRKGEGGRLPMEQRSARQRLLEQKAIPAYLKAVDDPRELQQILDQAAYSRRVGEKMLSVSFKLDESGEELKEGDLPREWSKTEKTQVLEVFSLLKPPVEDEDNDPDGYFSSHPQWKTLEQLSTDYRNLRTKKVAKTTSSFRSSEVVQDVARKMYEDLGILRVVYALAIDDDDDDNGGNKQTAAAAAAASIATPTRAGSGAAEAGAGRRGGGGGASFSAPPRASRLTMLTFPEWCLALLKLLVTVLVDSKHPEEPLKNVLDVDDARILGEKAKRLLQAGTVSAREQELYHFIEATQMDVWHDLTDVIRVIVSGQDLPEDASYVRRWRKMLLVHQDPLSLLRRLDEPTYSFRALLLSGGAEAAEAAEAAELIEEAHAFALNTRGIDFRLLRGGLDGRAALLMDVLGRDHQLPADEDGH